ncbi:hypothetical protein [Methanofollis ethanolicus]|uniref:hypothetical protein n=1 Tax=Methanofollis ethanolicus TaxID=488124 RepID=UPI000829F5CC|nr:hypothetical protein [Methanofollis ethanolicus]
MKGETALGIITVLTFLFILVFLLATSGAGGETTVPTTDTGAAAVTPAQTSAPLPTYTPKGEAADPVTGRWVSDPPYHEELVLRPDGTGTLTTVPENLTEEARMHTGVWEEDTAIRVEGMRAYHLTVLGNTESILYLRNRTDTLSRNGLGTARTYTRSP